MTSMDQIKKKNKAAPVKPFQVKNHMWIFVNAQIENPAFDSQTKDTLTLKSSAFGSKCDLSEDFVKKGQSSQHGLIDALTVQWPSRASLIMYSIGPSSSRTRS